MVFNKSSCSVTSEGSSQSTTDSVIDLTVDAKSSENDLYDTLLGGSALPILFGWWPLSSKWSRTELVERTTRCLPAVRPHMDIVALPLLTEVEQLWDCWSQDHGLLWQQAVWFQPRLEAPMPDDPALDVCKEVFQKILGSEVLIFYPMYCVPAILNEVKQRGLPIIGDPHDHELLPLNEAKAWIHPHISIDRGTPCMRDVLSALGNRVRAPRGFVAESIDELREAFRQLRQECSASTKFVLKPSSGSGGCGVVLDVKECDLEAFIFTSTQSSAILEEMIVGASVPESPTLYMIGDTPCAHLADQVLKDDGATNLGNRYPSLLPEEVFIACAEAAQEINKIWRMTSNWGLDFVIDKEGNAVVVDINMGRPNGNFAVRLWASRSEHPLVVYTGSWIVPENGPSIQNISDALRSANLLWNGVDGIIVYQHVPGLESSYAVASTGAHHDVDRLRDSLSRTMMDHFGMES